VIVSNQAVAGLLRDEVLVCMVTVWIVLIDPWRTAQDHSGYEANDHAKLFATVGTWALASDSRSRRSL